MSFSLPNFFFHATTAYDILRHKGAPLGNRDCMGKMKLKGWRAAFGHAVTRQSVQPNASEAGAMRARNA